MSFILFFFHISRCPFVYILSTMTSHEGKFCTKFLIQHNFICCKFYKLYKSSINISHNKTTGLWNNFNNLNNFNRELEVLCSKNIIRNFILQAGRRNTIFFMYMIETCAFFWIFRENVNVLKNSLLKMSNSIFIDWKLTKY